MTTFLEKWYLAFFLAAMACVVMLVAGCEHKELTDVERAHQFALQLKVQAWCMGISGCFILITIAARLLVSFKKPDK